jgi:hypothetical protein
VDVRVNNKIIFSFTDTLNNKNNLSSFIRVIKNQEYLFKDGELIIKKINLKTKFIKPILKNHSKSEKFITMDLETRLLNKEMSVYCISISDRKVLKTFYLLDYDNNIEKMLEDSIRYLMKSRYNNYKIYFHN